MTEMNYPPAKNNIEAGQFAYEMLRDLGKVAAETTIAPPEGATVEDAVKFFNGIIKALSKDINAFLEHNVWRECPKDLKRGQDGLDPINRLSIMEGIGSGEIDPTWVDIPRMVGEIATMLKMHVELLRQGKENG